MNAPANHACFRGIAPAQFCMVPGIVSATSLTNSSSVNARPSHCLWLEFAARTTDTPACVLPQGLCCKRHSNCMKMLRVCPGSVAGVEQPSTSGRSAMAAPTVSASYHSRRCRAAATLALVMPHRPRRSATVAAAAAQQERPAAANADWAARLLEKTSKKKKKKVLSPEEEYAKLAGGDDGFGPDGDAFDDGSDNAGGSMVEDGEERSAKRLPPEMRFFDTVRGPIRPALTLLCQQHAIDMARAFALPDACLPVSSLPLGAAAILPCSRMSPDMIDCVWRKPFTAPGRLVAPAARCRRQRPATWPLTLRTHQRVYRPQPLTYIAWAYHRRVCACAPATAATAA